LVQVVSQAELISRRGGWKRAGQAVVCPSSRFDLRHPGHICLLEHANPLPGIRVVAIEAARARIGWGSASRRNVPERPVTPATERDETPATLAAVDYATEFDERSSSKFLARLLPDVTVLGGKGEKGSIARNEQQQIERLGCKIVRVPLEPGHRTTLLIDRILELRS
jgi:bifunctional ADP-heptose synthase (sugar kinase/adenylyltransferase)